MHYRLLSLIYKMTYIDLHENQSMTISFFSNAARERESSKFFFVLTLRYNTRGINSLADYFRAREYFVSFSPPLCGKVTLTILYSRKDYVDERLILESI